MQSYNRSCHSKVTPLCPWEITADLLPVPMCVTQAYGVIPPHFNKVCLAAQCLLEALTDQAYKAT